MSKSVVPPLSYHVYLTAAVVASRQKLVMLMKSKQKLPDERTLYSSLWNYIKVYIRRQSYEMFNIFVWNYLSKC